MKFTAQLLEIGTYEQGESVTPCPKEPGCGARFCVGDRTFILPLTREQLGALDVGLYDCAEIEVRRPASATSLDDALTVCDRALVPAHRDAGCANCVSCWPGTCARYAAAADRRTLSLDQVHAIATLRAALRAASDALSEEPPPHDDGEPAGAVP